MDHTKERRTATSKPHCLDAGRATIGMSDSGAEIKIQIDLPSGVRLGPGKIALLELIGSEGSLSRAAEAMGISYRRAWLFVQQINAAFDEPAVATPPGGHGGAAAKLTDFGRELIGKFRQLETVANKRGKDVVKWLEQHERAV